MLEEGRGRETTNPMVKVEDLGLGSFEGNSHFSFFADKNFKDISNETFPHVNFFL